jgi:Domain of Unknown Function (DUF928)
MNNCNKQRITLLTIILLINLPFASFAIIKQPQHNSTIQSRNHYIALTWGDILNVFRRPKKQRGGRGDVCLISPGQPVSNTVEEIWSHKPLFTWQLQKGNATQIEVPETQWKNKINPGQTNINYNGTPLQPGQTYTWRLTAVSNFPKKTILFQFKLMESRKRANITKELTKLETKLKHLGASAEKIAMEKANYFAQKELWSDGIQQLYSIPKPSAELTQTIKQIQDSSCKQN